ncbi:hypothetical protein MK805_16230 [Shimazuella sp. AN120528]|uniref:hypothetical protein n=1 Tax=Shimazuella soli TaxID=1892854 RepID=UPI001F0EACAC|nr:hypothetical protein [Shimazuella soli]MCH5586488.1 hypothetical protein [Shimazuella soli]
MLRLTVEGEAEQVDQLWEHLSRDACLHLWDVSEMVKPNSIDKNKLCFLQFKEKKQTLSRVCMTTEKGEVISFDLSNCHILELETGKQLVLGYHYDIFHS